MVRLGSLNSRMNDFFDLWVLPRQFDFNGGVLASAISATFARRRTDLKPAFEAMIWLRTGDRPRSKVASWSSEAAERGAARIKTFEDTWLGSAGGASARGPCTETLSCEALSTIAITCRASLGPSCRACPP
jgi:hypothetical protein